MITVFEKIDKTGLKERFVREIQRKIFSGELLPGEQLPPERELAAQMGLSRSLVNVGILDLESKGFVRIEPRHGTFVLDYRKHPTPQTLAALMNYDPTKLDYPLFQSLMDTRRLVERECVRLSVARDRPDEYDGMRAALDNMRASDRDTAVDALFEFHYLLTQSSGNVVFPMIFKGFEPALRRLMVLHLQQQPLHEDYFLLHERLLSALEAQDAGSAEDLIMRILNTGISVLERPYKQA